jgi:hypothetical protein
MTEQGCRLLRLELLHPPECTLVEPLRALSLSEEVPVVTRMEHGSARLRAVIQTPLGERVLEG